MTLRSFGFCAFRIGNVEWSATGRAGVSLAEVAAVKDVAFAFGRAVSRLREMQGTEYAQKTRAEWQQWGSSGGVSERLLAR